MIVNNSGIRMFSKTVNFQFYDNQCDWVVPITGPTYKDVIIITPTDTSSQSDWVVYKMFVGGASQSGNTLTITIGAEGTVPDETTVEANVVIFY